VAAWQRALKDIHQLTVELPNGETRQATQGDLERLANMPLGEARRTANALFGDSADDVMLHRAKILDLAEQQEFGAEQAKKRAMEKSQLSNVQSREDSEKTRAAWTAANEQIVKRWPKMFGPVEEDPEGNAQLDKGRALADRLFSQTEENKPKSKEEAIALHAMLYQKIANHDRLAMWLKKARAELAQVKEELEQFRGSEPGGGFGGGPRGGKAGDYMQEAEAELDQLDRKSGV
jgi:DNA invertase Pin-like site-specific DNA recombinase